MRLLRAGEMLNTLNWLTEKVHCVPAYMQLSIESSTYDYPLI